VPRADAAAIARVVPGFEPETDAEERLAAHPSVLTGLAWGEPREGHPEGSVGAHVGDLLATIDAWGEEGTRREDLRLLALLHDAFKYAVTGALPKVGSNHHGRRARRFAEQEGLTRDERLLATLELHDRPYAIWRRRLPLGKDWALDRLAAAVPDHDLFVRFLELDASTEGKKPEPVSWIRSELDRRNAAG
jgi:hypothetical protein